MLNTKIISKIQSAGVWLADTQPGVPAMMCPLIPENRRLTKTKPLTRKREAARWRDESGRARNEEPSLIARNAIRLQEAPISRQSAESTGVRKDIWVSTGSDAWSR